MAAHQLTQLLVMQRPSDYIPEDIICSILCHLPAKSLLRFRCVSQKWKETIDSPLFIRKHLSLRKPLLLAQDKELPRYIVVDPDPDGTPSVHIHNDPVQRDAHNLVGTHHGVVCLRNRSNLVVWNPSIRKSLTLSVPWFGSQMYERAKCLGFWRDPCTEQFKCIALFPDRVGPHNVELEGVLYSSIRHEWREFRLEEMNLWKRSRNENPLPVLIRGVAYWRWHICKQNGDFNIIFRSFRHCYHPEPQYVVLSFDFSLEKFNYIEIPNLKCPLLCHWQGALALVCEDEQTYEIKHIYLRQDDLWVKMFSFSLKTPYIYKLLRVMGNEERVRVLGISYSDSVLWYTRDDTIPLLDEGYEFKIYYRSQVTCDFVESLLFPHLTVSDDYTVTRGTRVGFGGQDICTAPDGLGGQSQLTQRPNV